MHEPAIAYAMPNDDGVTVLACMPTKPTCQASRLTAKPHCWRRCAVCRAVRSWMTPPRVSKIIGTTDYPLIFRPAVPLPGLALIGDAALTSDPSQGVGCGWAFQTAEWLADAVAPALLAGGQPGPALRRYEHRRKALRGHRSTIEQEAKPGPPTTLDRLMLTAAVHDPRMAAHTNAFSTGPPPEAVPRPAGRGPRVVGERTQPRPPPRVSR